MGNTTKKNVITELRESGVDLSEREELLALVASTRGAALAVSDVLEVLLEDDAFFDLPEETQDAVEALALSVGLKQVFAQAASFELVDG